MKKFSVLAIAALWASTALAGSYHRGSSLICSDCHTMHSSRTHAFGGSANAGTDQFTASGAYQQGGAGNEFLLVAADPIDTCLACHDSKSGLPDVVGPNVNSNQRPGGLINLEGSGVEGTGHTMKSAAVDPPGWFAGIGGRTQNADVWTNAAGRGFATEFECDDCHAVHGNAAYRNLANGRGRVSGNYGWSGNQTAGYTWGLAPTYRYDATAQASGQLVPAHNDVDVVTVPSGKTVGNMNQGDNYNADQIAYTIALNDVSTVKYQAGFDATSGTPLYYGAGLFATDQNGGTSGKNKMNGFCGSCHGNFHGDSNVSLTPTTGKFKKHPTTGITMTAGSLIKNGSTVLNTSTLVYADLVIKPVFSAITAGSETFEPGCLTCHKAHGTKNSFGLVTPADPLANGGALYGTRDSDLESGDGSLATGGVRLLCIQCHSMGRTGAADQAFP